MGLDKLRLERRVVLQSQYQDSDRKNYLRAIRPWLTRDPG